MSQFQILQASKYGLLFSLKKKVLDRMGLRHGAAAAGCLAAAAARPNVHTLGGGEHRNTALPAGCKHGGVARGACRAADSEGTVVCRSRELVHTRHPNSEQRQVNQKWFTARRHVGVHGPCGYQPL